MDGNSIIQDFMNTSRNIFPTITSLLAACRVMRTTPGPDRPETSKDMSGLYNRDTCFEFHQLLVFTLLSFGEALDSYEQAYNNYWEKRDPQRLVKLENCVKTVYERGSLLWFIAYSRILQDHLKVLQNRWLMLPVNGKKQLDRFFDFTKFAPTKDQVIVSPTGENDGGADEAGSSGGGGVQGGEAEGDRVDEYGNEGGSDDAGNSGGSDEAEGDRADEYDNEGGSDEAGKSSRGRVEGDTVDDCGYDEGMVEGEEFQTIADKKHDLAAVYLEWIRLQVDRFQAPRKITSAAKRVRSPGVNLTLLAVRRPKPKPAGDVMDPWRSTIEDLCANNRKFKGLKRDEITRLLNDKISDGLNQEKKNPFFKKFHPARAQTYKYNATIHCEAALAALQKFPGFVAGDKILKDHIQV
jgi:hypothetical protein